MLREQKGEQFEQVWRVVTVEMAETGTFAAGALAGERSEGHCGLGLLSRHGEALRDGVPIALGYLAVSFSLGIAARKVGLATSALFAWAPLLSGVSEGVRTIILTVALSALAAALFPVDEQNADSKAADRATAPGGMSAVRPSIVAYLVVMSAVTLGTRILPLTLIRRPITNRFLRSFLYYVPYVTLVVMTFPAILTATDSPVAEAAALFVGVAAAWLGASLPQVAAGCCGVVFVLEQLLA